jgi:hypothetical protein
LVLLRSGLRFRNLFNRFSHFIGKETLSFHCAYLYRSSDHRDRLLIWHQRVAKQPIGSSISYNGSAGHYERGLEISVLAAMDVMQSGLYLVHTADSTKPNDPRRKEIR